MKTFKTVKTAIRVYSSNDDKKRDVRVILLSHNVKPVMRLQTSS